MDILTFISNLVKFLAWPVTVVVLALVFRNRLGNLLDRLIELKIHRVSLKLQGAVETMKKVRSDLRLPQVNLSQATERTIPVPAASTRKVPPVPDRQEFFQLDESEAPMAVLLYVPPILDPSVEFEMAWRAIEAELLNKARSFGGKRFKKAESAVRYLVQERVVPPDFLAAFAQVRAVYDAAKRHPNSPIDAELASEFKRTCDQLRLHLAQIDP